MQGCSGGRRCPFPQSSSLQPRPNDLRNRLPLPLRLLPLHTGPPRLLPVALPGIHMVRVISRPLTLLFLDALVACCKLIPFCLLCTNELTSIRGSWRVSEDIHIYLNIFTISIKLHGLPCSKSECLSIYPEGLFRYGDLTYLAFSLTAMDISIFTF